MPYSYYDPTTAAGRSQAAAFGANTLDDSTANDDPYSQWLASPVGQNWNTAQEAAAAQARKVADDEMAREHTALKQTAQRIAIEQGTAAANAWYQEEEAKIAQKRLDQEWSIHQDELALKQDDQRLNYAKAYTDYGKTYDQMFALNDFQDALGRIGSGLGPRPYGAANATAPTPKTFEGFQALTGFTPGSGATPSGTGYTPPAGSTDALGATNANGGPATPSGTGSTTDPRHTAAVAVLKAIPPTDDYGHDASSQAALAAVQNIWAAKRPGTSQRLAARPDLAEGTAAGLTRLGYYAPAAMAEMKTWNPGQGNPRAA